MKGTISDTAARILRDPTAREQLNKVVNSRTDGTVTVGGKTYSVRRPYATGSFSVTTNGKHKSTSRA